MLSSPQSRKVLILGVGRSGTTAIYSALQRILGCNFPDQTDFVYEPFLWDRDTLNKPFDQLGREFQDLSSLSVEGIYHHKSIPMFCSDLNAVSADTQTWLRQLFQPTDNKDHSVVKSIRACGRVSLLRKLVPDLKIIAMFRNPLEVINSSINMFSFFGDDFYASDYPRFIAEVNERRGGDPERLQYSEQLAVREFSYWLEMNRSLVQHTVESAGAILPIIHEDFVSNREETIARICDHVEIKYSQSFADFAAQDVGPVHKSNTNLTAQQFLFLESKLKHYTQMMSGLTSFNFDNTVFKLKEKYISGEFPHQSPATTNFSTSRHLRRQLVTKDQEIANLQQQLAGVKQTVESLRQNKPTPSPAAPQNRSQPHLEMTIAQKEQAIRELNSEMAAKNHKIEELKITATNRSQESEQLLQASADLQQQISDCNAEIEDLKSSLNASKVLISDYEIDTARQQQKYSDASEKIEQLTEQQTELQQQINKKHETVEQLHTELAAVRSQQLQLHRDLAAQESDALIQAHELAQSQAIIENLTQELDQEKSNVEEFISTLNDRESEIANLNQAVADLNSEISDQSTELDRFTREKEHTELRLHQTYAQLQERERSLGENVANQNQLFSTFKNDIVNQREKLSQYEDILGQLRKVTAYPLSQFERKLRAYRKLLRLYDEVKPGWHETKFPRQSRRRLKRTRRRVHRSRIDIGDQMSAFYGNHRSGWAYAVAALNTINTPGSIYVDTFIERTFCWNPNGIKPHTRPWVGFIHVPPFVPPWFQSEQSNQAVFESQAWKESAPFCRGLFTLSKYHRDYLQPQFDFPVENLIHPTEIPDQLWSWEAFQNNHEKRIVQLGWWLRKLHAIYQLPTSSYQKTLVKVSEQEYLTKLFNKEKEQLTAIGEFNDSMYESVEVLKFLPNNQYDQLLSQNIVFLNLYDSSANNSVIECIARGTPLLVNKIAPVVEYLGEDYPFYYETLPEAVEKASNLELVRQTHQHLMECETRKKLTGLHFVHSLLDSELMLNVYQNFHPHKHAA